MSKYKTKIPKKDIFTNIATSVQYGCIVFYAFKKDSLVYKLCYFNRKGYSIRIELINNLWNYFRNDLPIEICDEKCLEDGIKMINLIQKNLNLTQTEIEYLFKKEAVYFKGFNVMLRINPFQF